MTDQSPSDLVFFTKNLCLSQGNKTILRDINVDVSTQRIGIVGRNGSGKTTLARVLAGLLAPSSGSVSICGIDPAKDRKAALTTVGILFQNPDHQIIFPTVEEEIAFGLLQQGFDKAEAAEQVQSILKDFDKSHWAQAAVHQLSQGQKQLVCLMSILAMQPRVVILDEPFSGLDLPTKMQLARAFHRIDAAIVHVSHDPEALIDYDEILWIDEGTLKQHGPAKQVLPNFVDAMRKIGEADDLTHLTD
ncbi:biotin transport system ATP-binding protein [Pacificibacter maritimus]|uniref:Biotin transport system ATP-binding protein n=1 Tax=Pacificibacter maritimus TaxID=762213 RepID=A0A3N4TXR2_9RHOB|nr:ABC transporter ATP-binding protein [Pacificibacter maritimus]RPE63333.1 biotin transport system ATP-binding protein [Pacificibacter maritimus]